MMTKKSSQRGFFMMESLVALAMVGVLIAGILQLSFLSAGLQGTISTRQAATSAQMIMTELLSKRRACTNSFVGLNTAARQTPTQIRGVDATDIRFQKDINYTLDGTTGAIRLLGITLDNLRNVTPNPPLSSGTMDLTVEFTRLGLGAGPSSVFARLQLAVEIDAGNLLVSCMAIGHDFNQPWRLAVAGNQLVHSGNNVGIGTQTPAQKLSLIDPTAPAVSPPVANVSALGFYTPSDRRLKVVLGIRDGLADLEGLHGVRFKWKEGSDQINYGVIAQDIQAVIPEAVTETDGRLMVNYDQLLPSLIEATKALAREQEDLAEINRVQREQLRSLQEEIRSR